MLALDVPVVPPDAMRTARSWGRARPAIGASLWAAASEARSARPYTGPTDTVSSESTRAAAACASGAVSGNTTRSRGWTCRRNRTSRSGRPVSGVKTLAAPTSATAYRTASASGDSVASRATRSPAPRPRAASAQAYRSTIPANSRPVSERDASRTTILSGSLRNPSSMRSTQDRYEAAASGLATSFTGGIVGRFRAPLPVEQKHRVNDVPRVGAVFLGRTGRACWSGAVDRRLHRLLHGDPRRHDRERRRARHRT